MSGRQILLDSDNGPRLRIVGDTMRVLATGSDTGAYEVFEASGPRESGPPPHAHPWCESYFVLEGEVDVTLNGSTWGIGPGSFVNIPAGTVHCYRIASDAARFLVITSPAGASAFFGDMDRETAGACDDVAKVIGIAARHGVTVPPPPV